MGDPLKPLNYPAPTLRTTVLDVFELPKTYRMKPSGNIDHRLMVGLIF